MAQTVLRRIAVSSSALSYTPAGQLASLAHSWNGHYGDSALN
jgi:hypothetical protein